MEAWESKGSPLRESCTHSATMLNKSCGDRVSIFLAIKDGFIVEASQESIGCILCQGTASYLCDNIVGLSVDEVKQYDIEFDFEITPMRKKCAALPLMTLQEALGETTSTEG